MLTLLVMLVVDYVDSGQCNEWMNEWMNECLMTPQHEKQIGYWVSEKGKVDSVIAPVFLCFSGADRLSFEVTVERSMHGSITKNKEPVRQLDSSQTMHMSSAVPSTRICSSLTHNSRYVPVYLFIYFLFILFFYFFFLSIYLFIYLFFIFFYYYYYYFFLFFFFFFFFFFIFNIFLLMVLSASEVFSEK